jgi:hypothetical protein
MDIHYSNSGGVGPQGAPGGTGNTGATGPTGPTGASGTASAKESYTPTWSGTGLAFTDTPATGAYQQTGDVVQVSISVVCTNVTNFGTGQYSLTLPIAAASSPLIRGTLTIGSNIYDVVGICSPGSIVVPLYYWAGNPTKAEILDHNSPANWATTSKFDLYGSYLK